MIGLIGGILGFVALVFWLGFFWVFSSGGDERVGSILFLIAMLSQVLSASITLAINMPERKVKRARHYS